MKITTWNVNGIRAREGQVLEWLSREQPDVLCLQETKAPSDAIPPSLRNIEGYWGYWHGFRNYSGVGLHLKKARFPDPPHFFHPPFDEQYRVVAAQAQGICLASLYVPNGRKDFPAKMRFLERMDAYVASAVEDGIKLLWGGDFNVARWEMDVHPVLRKPQEVGQTQPERALLERILSRGLTDLARKFAPNDDRLFTWWAPWRNFRQRNFGWRLDLVVATEALAERALSCKTDKDFGTSDHAPVTAEFDL